MNFKFLSKDYPLEKSYFILSKVCLGSMGQFPQTSSSTLRNIHSLIHLLILFGGVVGQYWYGFYYLKVDLQEGLDAICPALSCHVSFIKMCLICWHSKDVAKVILHLQRLLFSERTDENQKIARSHSASASYLVFMVFSSGVVANLFYGLRPLLTNAIRLTMNKEYNFDDTPLKVMFPTVSLRLPWYPFTYGLCWYMGHVTVNSFSGVDGIFLSFCLYAAALLKILQNDIKDAMEQFGSKILSERENRACCERLAILIERHIEIIGLLKQFVSLFTWIILAHFVTSSVVIGASIIGALLYPGVRTVVYATYTMAVLCELYIYCYGGSAILENSSELGIAAYFTNWNNCDRRVQKKILMIIIRAQKPLTMAVPFFSPSLETFTSIIRTAGSIIAVVKSVL